MCIAVDIIGFRNFGLNTCANAISLCVHYVGVDSDEEMCVKESFLGFADASSTTGEELATVNKSYEIAFLFSVTA
jgi:hypothetical protein